MVLFDARGCTVYTLAVCEMVVLFGGRGCTVNRVAVCDRWFYLMRVVVLFTEWLCETGGFIWCAWLGC